MLKFVKRSGLAEAAPGQIALVQKATGLCAPVAGLLCARGVDTPEAAKRFLHPGPEQLHDPLLLPGMAQAAGRIRTAIARREKITVFCDYDADGTTGGSALYRFLRRAGAQVALQAPNRHLEGYGLGPGAVEQIAAGGSALIVTVDCGITNIEETALARSLGLDIVITDHHECGETLPDTPYIVSAKRRDSRYPDPNLAGCGVVFKLIHALSSLAEAMQYIDLIAIGTITDIVPLLGENRAIAHMGLGRLRRNPSAGILALAQAANISLAGIASHGVSFGLGPRINAAGRMDTAQLALDILKATKQSAALTQNARQLCALNDRRKQEVDEILADAQAMIDAHGYHGDPAIMLADSGWNAGVIGIAAAKIAEIYARPCVLFGGGASLIGSARSIPGVNIYEALAAFADRYEKFGGHAQAAGLTIPQDALGDLRRDVCGFLRTRYDESAFVRRRSYDLTLGAGQISRRLVEDLERLEPFGQGNEKPAVAVTNAAVRAPRFVGKGDKPHLKMTLAQDGASCAAVAFYYKDLHTLVPEYADFICEAGIDDFSGTPQLIVRDTAFRYSDALAQSFADAYAQRLTDGFFDEVARLGGGRGALSEAVFCARFGAAMEQSRFGLCVSVNTQPALMYLLALPAVRGALESGQCVLWDERAHTPDNCIACGEAAGHPRVLRAGVPWQGGALWNEPLKNAYRAHAADCFMARGELLTLYKRLQGLLAHRARTAADLTQKMGVSRLKAAFALRVFAELELLDVDKSDRILALKSGGQRKELRQSACYKGLEDLING